LYDALNDPDQPDQSLDVRRFLASQAIMLSLAGVPGIYAHSLFGSRNCHPCVKKSGQLRSINREKLIVSSLEIKLADPTSIQAMVFNGYTQLLRIRRRHPAFHPEASQKILFIDNRLFCLRRTSTDSTETLFCLINVSPDPANVKFYREIHEFRQAKCWIDEIGDRVYMSPHGELDLTVEGYQSLWLLPDR
jgi:sucrose phosphorylase